MFLNAEVEIDAFKFANSICDDPVEKVISLITEIVEGAANKELDKALLEYATDNISANKVLFGEDYYED